MPNIFISYRREDTSGDAGHLAADMRSRFGRSNVFIDIDTIAPGADFEVHIRHALDRSGVTFVLIGKRWLSVTLPDGTRRLDDEQDYVRREIAAALAREDVTVVPVLVEGATMPSASSLPADIASLTKRNAIDLSNKRWRYDVGQLCRVARRTDRGWSRLWRGFRRRYTVGAPLVVAAVVAVVLLLSGGSKSRPSCAHDLAFNPVTTTCGFAENVKKAYLKSRDHTHVTAYSPITGKQYEMRCTFSRGVVHCSGGRNASVTFPHQGAR